MTLHNDPKHRQEAQDKADNRKFRLSLAGKFLLIDLILIILAIYHYEFIRDHVMNNSVIGTLVFYTIFGGVLFIFFSVIVLANIFLGEEDGIPPEIQLTRDDLQGIILKPHLDTSPKGKGWDVTWTIEALFPDSNDPVEIKNFLRNEAAARVQLKELAKKHRVSVIDKSDVPETVTSWQDLDRPSLISDPQTSGETTAPGQYKERLLFPRNCLDQLEFISQMITIFGAFIVVPGLLGFPLLDPSHPIVMLYRGLFFPALACWRILAGMRVALFRDSDNIYCCYTVWGKDMRIRAMPINGVRDVALKGFADKPKVVAELAIISDVAVFRVGRFLKNEELIQQRKQVLSMLGLASTTSPRAEVTTAEMAVSKENIHQ